MSKVRLYELARELNVDSKILLNRVKGMGIDAATHQSTLSAEDAERVRSAVSGQKSSDAPKASSKEAAAAPAADNKPKVVVRRRKAEETPATETPPAVEAAPEAPVAAAKVAPPVVAAPPPVAPAPKPEPVVAKVAPLEAPAPVVAAPTPAPAPIAAAPTPAPPPKVEEPRKRPPAAGGATIVRRATPEEIEAQKAKAAKEKSDQYSSRTQRKEDSRGMRVTGVGLLQNRGGRPSGGGAPSAPGLPGAAVPEFGIGETRDSWTERKSKRSYEEENEEAQKAAKLQKLKRQNSAVNTRVLLNQLGDPEEEGVEELAVESAPEEAVGKTVFTPGLSDRRKDLKRRKNLKKTEITTPRASYRVVKVEETITLGELARQMNVKAADLIKKLMANGVMATINQDLDLDTTTLLANEFKYEVQVVTKTVEDIVKPAGDEKLKSMTRPPIVTVMGHVDHGKTSILDVIRKANVAAGEAGGITQHIGAYTVKHNGKVIAFLDTPGHEAFSSMRARGAKVTDIVVLVVAADDGVMPQTAEAISHAKSAGVPIIVAVNKMDKPNINLDRIYSQLAEHGIQAEEWGGENQFVKVSALQKTGINELLDAILLQAEVLELKAQPDAVATGSVIEAHLDKGRGPVATMMVQNGTLKVGQYIVAGMASGKVRAMVDHNGQKTDAAGPSSPVAIFGLDTVPSAGDQVNVVADERKASEVVELRQDQLRKSSKPKSSAASLDDLLGKIQSAETIDVSYIVKADTQGSLEAICEAILKLSTKKVSNRIIHKAVGGVTESDANLAATSGAVIFGFNVRAPRSIEEAASKGTIVLKYFSIIYDLVDAAKAIMTGKLPPIVTEVVIGHAQVRQPFSVPKVGMVAGSAVIDGKITRGSNLRLIRDNVVIYNGKVGSLRRFKDDVKEVQTGYECGISIDGYNDVREGDVIEAYTFEESAPSLA